MTKYPVRKRVRSRSYDYSRPGAYFVTMITRKRRPIFGTPTRTGILLTDAGRIVHESWLRVPERFIDVRIDAFVVMPDHVHAIIIRFPSDSPSSNVSQIVGWTKQRATRAIACLASPVQRPIWQTSFHDRVIHSQEGLTRARNYVIANPIRAWDDARCVARPGTRTMTRHADDPGPSYATTSTNVA